jgi:VIT1/CCC1 family predicted Fe2+/Mn2+ transporter
LVFWQIQTRSAPLRKVVQYFNKEMIIMQTKLPQKTEQHYLAPGMVHDIILGLADGLTVPFAIAAGLSITSSTNIVLIGGAAEIIGGVISMGLGGYLAAQGDMEHYNNEYDREAYEVIHMPEKEDAECRVILESWGLKEQGIAEILNEFHKDHHKWIDFMMRYELGLEKPDSSKAIRSALTIGGSYAVGGLVPLFPYMFIGNVDNALIVSAFLTLIVMFLFGYMRARILGGLPLREAIRTTIIGAVAAGAAYFITRLLRI